MIAIARARELQHQVLIVVKPEPDGGDRDPIAQELAAQLGKIRRLAWADIGLAVRKEHDAIEPFWVLELAHLARAFHDAGVDGSVAAHADLADARRKHRAVVDR